MVRLVQLHHGIHDPGGSGGAGVLGAVGADVLHGAGSDGPARLRQVLQDVLCGHLPLGRHPTLGLQRTRRAVCGIVADEAVAAGPVGIT